MKIGLGLKQHMMQVFDDSGVVTPVTVLNVGPLTVTQVKTVDKDGYQAIQVGFGTRSPKNINKAQQGHNKDAGNFRYSKEFRTDKKNKGKEVATYVVGDKIDIMFAEGDTVEISSVSKGKGFQGVVKRHGFHGGPRTHGQKHSEREPGSISGGLRTSLRSGMRMAGRMGSDRVTLKNVKITKIDPEAGIIFVSGAVPGRRGTLVEIKG